MSFKKRYIITCLNQEIHVSLTSLSLPSIVPQNLIFWYASDTPIHFPHHHVHRNFWIYRRILNDTRGRNFWMNWRMRRLYRWLWMLNWECLWIWESLSVCGRRVLMIQVSVNLLDSWSWPSCFVGGISIESWSVKFTETGSERCAPFVGHIEFNWYRDK